MYIMYIFFVANIRRTAGPGTSRVLSLAPALIATFRRSVTLTAALRAHMKPMPVTGTLALPVGAALPKLELAADRLVVQVLVPVAAPLILVLEILLA